jgi:hypothetical protein
MSATNGLTERQTEIKKLLDDMKTPGQIAVELGVTESAIYGHLRRMRENGHSVGSPGKTVRRATRSRKQNTGRPTLAVGSPVKIATPLQAIRARKEELERELRAAEKTVDDTKRAYVAAEDALVQLNERHSSELHNLTAAEDALIGNARPRQPSARRTEPVKPKAANMRRKRVAPQSPVTDAVGDTTRRAA